MAKAKTHSPCYNKSNNLRKTIEGILYRMKIGCPWRDLPKDFGASNTIFKAHRRWAKQDKFIQLFKRLVVKPDMEWVFIDATHVRAHQHSSGSTEPNPFIAKSAGGNTSKIHLAVDANGNPIEFRVTDGVTHDVKQAPDLLGLLNLEETEAVCADKGYDSDSLRKVIETTRCLANIPRKSNSKTGNADIDWYLYKIRHLVENAFAKLKHFRAVATRYDKLGESYANTVALACAYWWLKL